ncbi:MAG TPA: hypothetical protein VFE58_10290 [Tepidisphaeraceae bacterium]|jgi:hypothetical protein|nr:hypothetical protein [Tepidisphaeraceae bacterium]
MIRLFSIVAAAAVAVTASGVLASNVGVATGDLVFHYNPVSPEIPANQSYASITDAAFNFNPALTDNSSVGYGPDHYFQTLTNSFVFSAAIPLNASSPGVTAYTEYPLPVPSVPVASSADWAITDPAGGGFNSPLQGGTGTGSAITVTNESLTQVGTLFTLNLYGTLATDGLVHWVKFPTSDISTIPGLGDGTLYFHGVFTYNSLGDPGNDGQDVYAGVMTFDTAAIAVPLPASAWSGLALLGGLGAFAGMKRMRRQEA